MQSKARIDLFMGRFLNGQKKYESFWNIYRFVFLLSHGQSHVERGFNVSKDMLKDNLQDLSLISMCMVYDFMKSKQKEAHDFEIDKELLLCVKTAHKAYDIYKKDCKNDADKQARASKRKTQHDELCEVKKRKLDEEASVSEMQKDVTEFLQKAHVQATLQGMKKYVDKANSFTDTIKQKESVITDLQTAIVNIEEEMKILSNII